MNPHSVCLRIPWFLPLEAVRAKENPFNNMQVYLSMWLERKIVYNSLVRFLRGFYCARVERIKRIPELRLARICGFVGKRFRQSLYCDDIMAGACKWDPKKSKQLSVWGWIFLNQFIYVILPTVFEGPFYLLLPSLQPCRDDAQTILCAIGIFHTKKFINSMQDQAKMPLQDSKINPFPVSGKSRKWSVLHVTLQNVNSRLS